MRYCYHQHCFLFCLKAFVGMHIKKKRSIFICSCKLSCVSELLVNTVSQRCIKSANEIIFCSRCHFCHIDISAIEGALGELDVP